uniref:efflux RND transporter periplasmic adaptor subunit n=1 Tax=Aminiphilus sp. TaxID=1872488 RepID=UPI00261FB363
MKKLLFLFLLCLVGGGVYLGFFREHPEELRFITVSLARGDVTTTVSATGTVEAVNTVTVGTQVSGTIQKILADYNSRVKKGDVIAIIDPVLVQAEVAQKEAALGAARAAVREVQATLADAKRTLERQKKLYALQYIAESDLDSAQSAVDVAEAKLGSARAQVEQAQASLKYAKAN